MANSAAAKELGTVAVYERNPAERARVVELCQQLGYRVVAASTIKKITRCLRDDEPPDLVVTSLPHGEKVVQAARRCAIADQPLLIGAVEGPPSAAPESLRALGVDLRIQRPIAADCLATAIGAAGALRLAQTRARAAELASKSSRERMQRYGDRDAVTGFQHMDFFETLLVRELKRARRYGHSLALCMVAIDPWHGDRQPSAEAMDRLRSTVAAAVRACIRDIDIPVDVAEDRFLVFLPHADLEGAERVGNRVAEVVRSYGHLEDAGDSFQMSVSVGISAVRKGKPVRFAQLMRDALTAVRASQLKGGGRVVVRR